MCPCSRQVKNTASCNGDRTVQVGAFPGNVLAERERAGAVERGEQFGFSDVEVDVCRVICRKAIRKNKVSACPGKTCTVLNDGSVCAEGCTGGYGEAACIGKIRADVEFAVFHNYTAICVAGKRNAHVVGSRRSGRFDHRAVVENARCGKMYADGVRTVERKQGVVDDLPGAQGEARVDIQGSVVGGRTRDAVVTARVHVYDTAACNRHGCGKSAGYPVNMRSQYYDACAIQAGIQNYFGKSKRNRAGIDGG